MEIVDPTLAAAATEAARQVQAAVCIAPTTAYILYLALAVAAVALALPASNARR